MGILALAPSVAQNKYHNVCSAIQGTKASVAPAVIDDTVAVN